MPPAPAGGARPWRARAPRFDGVEKPRDRSPHKTAGGSRRTEQRKESQRGDLLAETYRLQGELLLARATGQDTEAEACFRQALDIARRQQAKSWELRAAMSLARLWQRQGKRDAARQVLTEVYGWFTEGFDTADLQEAKALLDQLL